METRTYTVWNFNEAPEEVKAKILQRHADINIDHDWWDAIYYDANELGLTITDFDTYRGECNGQLEKDMGYTISKILENHGPETETYKLAKAYQPKWAALEPEDEEDDKLYDLNEEFLTELLSLYLTMLRSDYEYLTTEEAIIETLEANEYTFKADGSID